MYHQPLRTLVRGGSSFVPTGTLRPISHDSPERRRVMTTITTELMPANTTAPTTDPKPGTVHTEATTGKEVNSVSMFDLGPRPRRRADLDRIVTEFTSFPVVASVWTVPGFGSVVG